MVGVMGWEGCLQLASRTGYEHVEAQILDEPAAWCDSLISYLPLGKNTPLKDLARDAGKAPSCKLRLVLKMATSETRTLTDANLLARITPLE